MNHTRAYKRHLPDEYIEQLWKLIQTRSTKKSAYSGDARILLQLHCLFVLLQELRMIHQVGIRIGDHRAKLESKETPVMQSNNLSEMENITTIIELDTNCNNQENGHQQ